MTIFYHSTTQTAQPSEAKITLWTHLANKTNWRITELENGYFQTEFSNDDAYCAMTRRMTLGSAEEAIDETVAHYKKRLEFLDGPKVVKTFEK
jgi:hypothetical protein